MQTDYDITILYHLGKTNVVADTLSRETYSMGSLVIISVEERPLARYVQRLANNLVRLWVSELMGSLIAFIGLVLAYLSRFVSVSLMMRNYGSFEQGDERGRQGGCP
ncbi:hypothetical protein MTR67_052642 [Solanum verrucosum]|uniref:Uncharacterized protein n=1 Tax=Solanum verrucosum TaxID=315347 RepID=A0AAF0V6I4_SOLVR|nr:hypothetical protein MTR67_052642 [Solanum verrucosum]